jgi:membrane associated rhomboid family serine protease
MGINDRDYYQQRYNPSFGQSPWDSPMRLQPGITPVVKWLLIINIAIFIIAFLGERVFQLSLFMPKIVYNEYDVAIGLESSPFIKIFGIYSPYLIGKFFFWQFITYQFIHSTFLHIFVNMFTLFMIGRHVERQIGSVPFLRLYLIGGVFAGLLNLVFHLFVQYPTIGASGSICAILATFGLMNPHTRLMLFIWFFPVIVKARTLVIVYAVITVLMSLQSADGIAHLAHLGGLIFGWMYVYNILHTRKWINRGTSGATFPQAGKGRSFMDSFTSLFRHKPKLYKGEEFEDAQYSERPSEKERKEDWDPRIDEILDKMTKQGMHTLTDEEWEILKKHRKL